MEIENWVNVTLAELDTIKEPYRSNFVTWLKDSLALERYALKESLYTKLTQMESPKRQAFMQEVEIILQQTQSVFSQQRR